MVVTDVLYMPTIYGSTKLNSQFGLGTIDARRRFEPLGASDEDEAHPRSESLEVDKPKYRIAPPDVNLEERDKRLSEYTAAVRALYQPSSDEGEMLGSRSQPKPLEKPKFWLGNTSPELPYYYASVPVDDGPISLLKCRRRRKRNYKSSSPRDLNSGSSSDRDQEQLLRRDNAGFNRSLAMWNLKELCRHLPPGTSSLKPNLDRFIGSSSLRVSRIKSHKRSISLSKNDSSPVYDHFQAPNKFLRSRPAFIDSDLAPKFQRKPPNSLTTPNQVVNMTIVSVPNDLVKVSMDDVDIVSQSNMALPQQPMLTSIIKTPTVIVVTQEAELYSTRYYPRLPHEAQPKFKSLPWNLSRNVFKGDIQAPDTSAINVRANIKSFYQQPTSMQISSQRCHYSHNAFPNLPIVEKSPVPKLYKPNFSLSEPTVGNSIAHKNRVGSPVYESPDKTSPFASLRVARPSKSHGKNISRYAQTLPTISTKFNPINRASAFEPNKTGMPDDSDLTTTLDLNDIFDTLDSVLQESLDIINNPSVAIKARAEKKVERVDTKCRNRRAAPTIRSHSVTVYDENKDQSGSYVVNSITTPITYTGRFDVVSSQDLNLNELKNRLVSNNARHKCSKEINYHLSHGKSSHSQDPYDIIRSSYPFYSLREKNKKSTQIFDEKYLGHEINSDNSDPNCKIAASGIGNNFKRKDNSRFTSAKPIRSPNEPFSELHTCVNKLRLESSDINAPSQQMNDFKSNNHQTSLEGKASPRNDYKYQTSEDGLAPGLIFPRHIYSTVCTLAPTTTGLRVNDKAPSKVSPSTFFNNSLTKPDSYQTFNCAAPLRNPKRPAWYSDYISNTLMGKRKLAARCYPSSLSNDLTTPYYASNFGIAYKSTHNSISPKNQDSLASKCVNAKHDLTGGLCKFNGVNSNDKVNGTMTQSSVGQDQVILRNGSNVHEFFAKHAPEQSSFGTTDAGQVSKKKSHLSLSLIMANKNSGPMSDVINHAHSGSTYDDNKQSPCPQLRYISGVHILEKKLPLITLI